MDDTGRENRPAVRVVVAEVELQTRMIERSRRRIAAGEESEPYSTIAGPGGEGILNLSVRLSAITADGRRIRNTRTDFSIAGAGDRRTVEESVERTLGRDPEHNAWLASDPDLPDVMAPAARWQQLLMTLRAFGIRLTADALIATPLVVDLHPEVQVAFAAD